jgi:hypothetical protein
MIAPNPVYTNDQPSLLADVRGLLHVWPQLDAYPERLAALLRVDEYAVRHALEALEVDDEVLA